MTDTARIAELRALCAAALPAPWTFDHGEIFDANWRLVGSVKCVGDTAFIAAARDSLPWALDEAEKMRDLWQGACDTLGVFRAENERLRAENARMLPVVEAALREHDIAGSNPTLAFAIKTYRASEPMAVVQSEKRPHDKEGE